MSVFGLNRPFAGRAATQLAPTIVKFLTDGRTLRPATLLATEDEGIS